MRVNISYSVDLDKVPNAVASMVMQIHTDYKSLSTRLAELQISLKSEPNITTCLKEIDDIRKAMIEVDASLSDCSTILAGYQNVINDSFLPQKEEEEESEEESEE